MFRISFLPSSDEEGIQGVVLIVSAQHNNNPVKIKRAGGNHLILIAGGADKNLDFTKLAKLIVKKVGAVILLKGTATNRLKKEILKYFHCHPERSLSVAKDLANSVRPGDSSPTAQNDRGLFVKEVNSMREAVKLAQQESKAGDIVLLSPACASFGMFRHEFEREKKFTNAVLPLKYPSKILSQQKRFFATFLTSKK